VGHTGSIPTEPPAVLHPPRAIRLVSLVGLTLNCEIPESFYSSTNNRPSLDAGDPPRVLFTTGYGAGVAKPSLAALRARDDQLLIKLDSPQGVPLPIRGTITLLLALAARSRSSFCLASFSALRRLSAMHRCSGRSTPR
jgi:hypothetical protein